MIGGLRRHCIPETRAGYNGLRAIDSSEMASACGTGTVYETASASILRRHSLPESSEPYIQRYPFLRRLIWITFRLCDFIKSPCRRQSNPGFSKILAKCNTNWSIAINNVDIQAMCYVAEWYCTALRLDRTTQNLNCQRQLDATECNVQWIFGAVNASLRKIRRPNNGYI